LVVPVVMLNSAVEFSDGVLIAKNELVLTKLSIALMPSCVTLVAVWRRPETDEPRVSVPITAIPACNAASPSGFLSGKGRSTIWRVLMTLVSVGLGVLTTLWA